MAILVPINLFIFCLKRFGVFLLKYLLLAILLAACSTIAPSQGASKDERIAFFRSKADKVMQRLEGKQEPGLIVWVEVEGQVIYNKSVGLANKNQKVPIDVNTVFKLASVSKPLTATAVLQLAEDGLLNIDDAAVKWLPELPVDWSTITVRNLLAHSSGVPDYIKRIDISKVHELDKLTNLQLLERWRANSHLNFKPGTDVEYSNSNYVLLAEIVAKVCNTSFAQCLRQRMFSPLSMTHTRMESEAAPVEEILALNYANTTLTDGINLLTEGPIGIYSSLADTVTWLHAYQAGKIVSYETIELMTMPASSKPLNNSGERYGLGWFLPAENTSVSAYAHSGRQDGYRTLIRANPKQHINCIIFDNGGDLLEQSKNELWYWVQQSFEN